MDRVTRMCEIRRGLQHFSPSGILCDAARLDRESQPFASIVVSNAVFVSVFIGALLIWDTVSQNGVCHDCLVRVAS